MIKYLIEKEFKQIFRNLIIPKIIVALPLMAMLVFPWAANHEIKNINVDIVDNDHSAYSKRLINKIAASSYFVLSCVSSDNAEALKNVESGQTDIILEIQPDFEKHLTVERIANVMISANGVNGMKGILSASYMSGIVDEFASELNSEQISTAANRPTINVVPHNLFNVFMDYKVFMLPALIVMLLTVICGFLPALNIVSEKESGTIEQINVTPVGKFAFIISKLIPYWLIGFFVLNFCLILIALVYGLTPAGNIFTIYFFSAVYILAVSGIGLVISNYSENMQQSMFTIFFFIIVMILMSGLFTPVASMPQWAQNITIINPLKYFIQVMRMIFLKGSAPPHLTEQFATLCCFALIFNIWAVLSYRKCK
ncbi:MAG: ABC transporter permease [Prevotellaceae bacterium]|jgi:ABC-2 type transport system permease protein|nr:ABC transporter permease [Prevotellaceae bacterium]